MYIRYFNVYFQTTAGFLDDIFPLCQSFKMKIQESGCKLFAHELCPAGLSLEDFREEVRTAKAIRPCQGLWSESLMASNV